MFVRILTYGCFLLFLCISCEQETTWDFGNSESHVVVDAIITSEYKPQEVFIYQSPGGLNEEVVYINNAHIFVTNGTDTAFFEPTGNSGRYQSNVFATTVDQTYMMVIQIGDYSDTAYASMIPITPFKNDTVYKANNLYKFIYAGSDLPAMTEVYYDWSHLKNYCETYGSCYAKSVHYTLNNIDIAEEFGPDKQEIWFPSGTTLIRKKYSLSSDHEKFVRSLLMETEWRGGLFDVEQGNVPSNFSNNTKGFFAVCMVLNDTTVVD